MTGYYSLHDKKPCTIYVDGAFEQQTPGVGKVSGTMTVGDLQFTSTVFVPGIRETIISLGQLDKEGCTTTLSQGKLSVDDCTYTGEVLFSAFLHIFSTLLFILVKVFWGAARVAIVLFLR